MDTTLVGIVRWVHIACAIVAIGGAFFVRFAMLPAAGKTLDDATQHRFREAIDLRWSKVVYAAITLFILTGLFNFLYPVRVNGVLLTSRWRDFSDIDRKIYHMVFGIKMIGALTIFFLASALAGKTTALAAIRKKPKAFLLTLLVTAAGVVACSVVLRYLK